MDTNFICIFEQHEEQDLIENLKNRNPKNEDTKTYKKLFRTI